LPEGKLKAQVRLLEYQTAGITTIARPPRAWSPFPHVLAIRSLWAIPVAAKNNAI